MIRPGDAPNAKRNEISDVRRVARLSQPCHDLLVALAVVGPDTHARRLAALLGNAPAELVALVDESGHDRMAGSPHSFDADDVDRWSADAVPRFKCGARLVVEEAAGREQFPPRLITRIETCRPPGQRARVGPA